MSNSRKFVLKKIFAESYNRQVCVEIISIFNFQSYFSVLKNQTKKETEIQRKISVPLYLCVEKKSIILCHQFKETLGMVADGADFRGCRTNDDVSAVAALPDAVAIT